MFSQTAEYALRAAVTLAQQPERPFTAAELAHQTGVPSPHLLKVMGQLARAGVVRALRGKREGYRLDRPPAQIILPEVVSAVDPLPRLHRCPLDRPEHAQQLCPLHRELYATYAQLEATLHRRCLADLLAEDTAGSPQAAAPAPLCAPQGGWGTTGKPMDLGGK
ncbi:Rrf2 family transcriptional regulator [Deinococcus aquaedulcis]|uniref:Rrf2 family transcriptional regulator n=1 Tax=Deinococcus aquaedulcis TaxID=2840455 RepID=UPI001C83D274|nr:Rrf2 family transcriptional regulator [Deinococcus aquaedulcis]